MIPAAAVATAILLCAGTALRPAPQEPAAAAGATPRAPALVVLISVDQLPSYALRQAWPFLGERGFHRLAREGVEFTACAIDYSCTETAPGHASLATGAWPSEHGITGNDWVDHATRRTVYCVADDDVRPVGDDKAARYSPANLLAPTLGDTMKAFLGARVRVMSLSLKDRSAILLGGKSADLAAWLDLRTGALVSSTWYGAELPEWLARWNAEKPADGWFGKVWDRCAGDAAYAGLTDDRPFETPGPGGTRTLPAVVDGAATAPGPTFYEHLYWSPFGNELLLAAATAALDGTDLGRGQLPDLLCLGFSSTDPIGHRCGPDSVEARDALLRVDRDLGVLLDRLDARIGAGRFLVLVSSDHGVLPIPEGWRGARIPGGRRLIAPQVTAAADQALRETLGAPPEGVRRWVAVNDGYWLYLAPEAATHTPANALSASEVAAAAAARLPHVARAVAVSRLLQGDAGDELQRLLRHAIYPPRCGDVAIVRAPMWIEGVLAATHGSPYAYDREVPLFAMGGSVLRGVRCEAPVEPGLGVVIAARVLHIPPPACAHSRVPAGVLAY